MKIKKIDGIKCGFIADNEFKRDMEALACKLEQELINPNCTYDDDGYKILSDIFKPFFIYGIPRGGLIPAVYLSHMLGMSMTHITPIPLVRNKLMIVDDIFDTGKTYEQHKDKCWKFVCVYLKDKVQKCLNIGNPKYKGKDFDYETIIHAKIVPDIPIIFPWENAKSVINHMKESGRL